MATPRKWLEDRLAETGKSKAALARALDVKSPRVHEMIRGERRMSATEIPLVAAFLEVSANAIMLLESGRAATLAEALAHASETPQTMDRIEVPNFGEWPRDVPVLGTVRGGIGGDFEMSGTVVDRVRRPPGIASARNVFALFVDGESMEPRYVRGDLIYVNPSRPAAPGDDVVVEMYAADGEHGGAAYVKQLVSRSPVKVVCRQHSPAGLVEYDATKVRQVLRIMRLAELMGV